MKTLQDSIKELENLKTSYNKLSELVDRINVALFETTKIAENSMQEVKDIKKELAYASTLS